MATVQEILRNAGLSDYEINTLDERTTQAFGQVLSEAELQKTSVDAFWRDTYSPGIAAWEQERSETARRIASVEARNAAYERERQVLAEQGIVTKDNLVPPRNAQGEYVTPGSPTFTGDPNEFVGKVAQGLSQLSDIEFTYRSLYNSPLPILPSEIIGAADRAGVTPMQYADRQWKFSEKKREIHDNQIRQEAETKVRKEFAEKTGSNPDMVRPSGSAKFADVRRAVERGELKDPLKLDAAGRRKQALEAIHKHIEEREQRDA